MAAANGYYDVLAFLLRCGVQPTVRDNDLWQPIHAAACWAQPDIIELLCEYGADVVAKTAAGETPLGKSIFSTPLTSHGRQLIRCRPMRRRANAGGDSHAAAGGRQTATTRFRRSRQSQTIKKVSCHVIH